MAFHTRTVRDDGRTVGRVENDADAALTRYLVELRTPEAGWNDLDELAERARAASESMRSNGVCVRFLRSVYVPEDETCFFLFEAERALDVAETARSASLSFSRVEDTIALTAPARSEGVAR